MVSISIRRGRPSAIEAMKSFDPVRYGPLDFAYDVSLGVPAAARYFANAPASFGRSAASCKYFVAQERLLRDKVSALYSDRKHYLKAVSYWLEQLI